MEPQISVYIVKPLLLWKRGFNPFVVSLSNHDRIKSITINLLEPTLRQALNEQLFIYISIKHLQGMKNRQTVSKQCVNLFAARALPRVCGAYLAQGERGRGDAHPPELSNFGSRPG